MDMTIDCNFGDLFPEFKEITISESTSKNSIIQKSFRNPFKDHNAPSTSKEIGVSLEQTSTTDETVESPLDLIQSSNNNFCEYSSEYISKLMRDVNFNCLMNCWLAPRFGLPFKIVNGELKEILEINNPMYGIGCSVIVSINNLYFLIFQPYICILLNLLRIKKSSIFV